MSNCGTEMQGGAHEVHITSKANLKYSAMTVDCTSNRQEVSEHRGHPGTGNWQDLVWRFECLMFGYFLPVPCMYRRAMP